MKLLYFWFLVKCAYKISLNFIRHTFFCQCVASSVALLQQILPIFKFRSFLFSFDAVALCMTDKYEDLLQLSCLMLLEDFLIYTTKPILNLDF